MMQDAVAHISMEFKFGQKKKENWLSAMIHSPQADQFAKNIPPRYPDAIDTYAHMYVLLIRKQLRYWLHTEDHEGCKYVSFVASLFALA